MASKFEPIVVNTGPLPATAAALFRILVAVLGPVAVSKGWIDGDKVQGVATLLAAVVCAGYGLMQTHRRQTNLNDAAAGTPIVKGTGK